MKKIVSIILLAVMISLFSFTIFAQDINVSFNVDPTYTVIIPTEVVLEPQADGTYAKDQTISATNVRLSNGSVVKVTLVSGFKLKNAEDTVELPYKVKIGEGSPINSGEEVAKFTTNGNLAAVQTSETLHFIADKPEYAGNYSDTVTFTISVVSAS